MKKLKNTFVGLTSLFVMSVASQETQAQDSNSYRFGQYMRHTVKQNDGLSAGFIGAGLYDVSNRDVVFDVKGFLQTNIFKFGGDHFTASGALAYGAEYNMHQNDISTYVSGLVALFEDRTRLFLALPFGVNDGNPSIPGLAAGWVFPIKNQDSKTVTWSEGQMLFP